jgi:hypothetical protein
MQIKMNALEKPLPTDAQRSIFQQNHESRMSRIKDTFEKQYLAEEEELPQMFFTKV